MGGRPLARLHSCEGRSPSWYGFEGSGLPLRAIDNLYPFLLSLCVGCRQQALHRKAISVVRNLLASHDVDPRYHQRDAKARIATLYVPLIGIVIDALPQLCIESQSPRPSIQQQQSSGTEMMNDVDDDDAAAAAGIDHSVAMAIAGSSVYSIAGESTATVTVYNSL